MKRYLLLSLFFLGCGSTGGGGGGGGATAIPEIAYCSTIVPYAGGATITGSAAFNRRGYTASGGAGLGAVEGTAYPIRFAEIVVMDVTGSTVQCGETNASGQFSVVVPKNSQALNLVIRSRGINSSVNASVLDAPLTNVPYELRMAFSSTGDQNLGSITALATGDLLGGAFNIFDQIVRTNIFLAAQTASCATFVTGCAPFSPSIKIQAYWKKGFNPGTYVGSSGGLSFYMPGEKKLYILGGVGGDPNNSDTDHFDNTIIIHEYGHFLEDQYSKTDSPGGYHSGGLAIDPRLAWSEGFADYLGLAVTGDPIYRDTIGNIDGTTNGFGVYAEAKSGAGNGPAIPYRATTAGEGNFKEFAIASFLWDATITTGGQYITSSTFGELWAVFTGPFRSSTAGFRDIGLLMSLRAGVANATTATNYDARLTVLNMRRDRQDYARSVLLTGGACTTVSWTYGANSLGFFTNLRTYQYTHPGGALSLTLDHLTGTADLDLYLMNPAHTIIKETGAGYVAGLSGVAGKSDQLPATSVDETISLPSLAAGSYLIVVNAVASSGGTTTYRMLATNSSITGATACPQ